MRKCEFCNVAEAMTDDIFCGFCAEGMDALWEKGWKLTPPERKEKNTVLAMAYQRYASRPRREHVQANW